MNKEIEDEQKITQEKTDYLKWRLSIVAKEKKHLTERIHRLELEKEMNDSNTYIQTMGRSQRIKPVYISKDTSKFGTQYKVYLNIRSEEFLTIGRQESYTDESKAYWGTPDFTTHTKQYCRALLGKVRQLHSINNLDVLEIEIRSCINEISHEEIK